MPPSLRGRELLADPVANKGTAFSDAERTALGLHGLLPPFIETLDQQAARAWEAYARKPDDLERHIYLRGLQDTNEVLFYRLLLDHIPETLPVVYTPVVADACREFSHIYRRPRGLILSYPLRDSMLAMLRNRPYREVDVVVVTDGERILGIGDQGVGGLAIPIGKLSLYSLVGGIPPARTLPIVLDVGTNNPERLRDPEYLGWRHERIAGAPYEAFIGQFIAAVRLELPHVCLQWEDFATAHVQGLLERYRHQLLTFNDDIQGTAAVTRAAATAAVSVAGGRWRDQQIVMLGAGAAALGVAEELSNAMTADGLAPAEARQRLWLVNSRGLLHAGRSDLSPRQREFAQPLTRLAAMRGGAPDLKEVVRQVDATMLIGLSTVAGAFSEPIVRELARKTARPIIFPLSNPTECSEATPADLARWTEGRALVATGSPFAPVSWKGRVLPVAQCNNVYIFPGVGLGAVAARARRVSHGMLVAAAEALARLSPAFADAAAPLLPPLEALRETAVAVAVAVAAAAQTEGLAPVCSAGDLEKRIRAAQWMPSYSSGM